MVPRRSSYGVVIALAIPLVVLAPLALAGEPQKAPPEKTEKSDRYDPDNVSALSQYMELLVKSNERFAAKDTTAAIDGYKKAIQLSPKHPLAHYLLAEAYLQTSNLGEAEAALSQALPLADAKNLALRGRVLFLSADVQERQKKWAEARTAWQAYAEFAARNADGSFPQTAAERIKAIQKVLDAEKAYVAVRERIANEKSDGGKKK